MRLVSVLILGLLHRSKKLASWVETEARVGWTLQLIYRAQTGNKNRTWLSWGPQQNSWESVLLWLSLGSIAVHLSNFLILSHQILTWLSSNNQVTRSASTLSWLLCSFFQQTSMSAPLRTVAVMTSAATPSAATTANVRLARNWRKMENHVEVMFCTVYHCY